MSNTVLASLALALMTLCSSCALDSAEQSSEICVPKAATYAELSLSPPLTAGALDGVKLRAREPGAHGNDIAVSFVDDAILYVGSIEQCSHAVTVHYEPAWSPDGITYYTGSQVWNIQDLFATSTLIEFVGEPGYQPQADLQQDEDAFRFTYLSGGADAVTCP